MSKSLPSFWLGMWVSGAGTIHDPQTALATAVSPPEEPAPVAEEDDRSSGRSASNFGCR